MCAVAAELELASGDAAALVSALQRGTALRSRELRRAVLGDLALRVRSVELPWLRRTIADRNAPEDLRQWAVAATASLDLPELPPELAALLDRDESVGLRQAALRAHGTRGGGAELDVLRRGLDDPDPGVRLAAVDAFATPAAVSLLARHFDAERAPEVRLAIVGRLGSAGTPAALDALRALRAGATDPSLREMIDLALAAAESRAPGAGGR